EPPRPTRFPYTTLFRSARCPRSPTTSRAERTGRVTVADGVYVRQLELGPMQNFVYLVGDPVVRECVVVDPAWEIDTIVDTAAARSEEHTSELQSPDHLV